MASRGIEAKKAEIKSKTTPTTIENGAKEVVLVPNELFKKNESDTKNIPAQVDAQKEIQKKSLDRNQLIYLVILLASVYTDLAALSLMAPFYPTESSNKGMSETTAGLVFSFFAFVIFVTSPLYGALIPKLGVKTVFCAGLAISGVCNVIFGTLHYVNHYYFFTVLSFAVRGVGALGVSATTNSAFVLVSVHFPDHGGFVRGLIEGCVGLGLGTGPVIGGLLFTVGGFGLPFYSVGSFMLLLVVVSAVIFPNSKFDQVHRQKGSLKIFLKLPRVIVTALTVIVAATTWTFLEPTLEPHLRKFHFSAATLGLIFFLPSALYGICSPICGKITDKVANSCWWLMMSGLCVCSFSLLFLGPSTVLSFLENRIWLDLVALAGVGIATAMTLMPTYQSLLDGALEGGLEENEITHSFISSLWTTSNSLGEIIGPAIGGAILEHWSFSTATTIMAALNITMSILLIGFFLSRRRVKTNPV